MGVGGQHHAQAALPPGKETVPIFQEAGYGPGPVWKGAENLAPTEIPSPDCPARSELLYRLRYPGRHAKTEARWTWGQRMKVRNYKLRSEKKSNWTVPQGIRNSFLFLYLS